ncbi:MAG: trigger factor [Lachnospiraceae bacterium]|nr:trigger factor [Lachnospiraceae bacterium]
MKKQYIKAFSRLVAVSLTAAAVMLIGCGSEESGSLETIDPFKYVTLGDYAGLTVEPIDATVSEDDVQSNIENILNAHSEAKEVTGRAAKLGDTVNIDYVGTENGVAFDGGTGNKNLELGSGIFIPGFEDGVVGMEKGETKVLNLTFPKDYGKAELAGKAVEFEVTVNSISENVIPEFTDEFVKSLNTEATTVEEYKEQIKKEMTEQRETGAKADTQAKLMKMAVDNAKCDISKLPEWLVSGNTADYKNSTESYVTQYGVDMASYLEAIGSSEEEFNKEAEEYGKEVSKSQLVVLAIAKQEGLSVTDKDMEDYYAEYAADYNATVDMVKEVIPKDDLKNYLLQQKVMDYLYDEAILKK